MTRDNVAVVREVYERFPDLAAGEPPDGVLDLFDPEVLLDQTRNVFNPATYEGRDGVLRALAMVRETWEQFRMEPERFVDAGDDVVVIQSVRARGLGGGVEVLGRSASVHTLRDGRITGLTVYPDPDEGLRAAGVAAAANVDVVRALYEAWNGSDRRHAALAFIAEDFEWVNPSYAVEPGTRHGHEGWLAAMDSLESAFHLDRHEPLEFLDRGSQVLCFTTFVAKTSEDGPAFTQDETHLWTLRDGKVVRLEWFHDRREAIEALDGA